MTFKEKLSESPLSFLAFLWGCFLLGLKIFEKPLGLYLESELWVFGAVFLFFGGIMFFGQQASEVGSKDHRHS